MTQYMLLKAQKDIRDLLIMNLNYVIYLRTDFRFRYDYAQYAISQPISFDWNNRFFRNTRFNRYNNYNQTTILHTTQLRCGMIGYGEWIVGIGGTIGGITEDGHLIAGTTLMVGIIIMVGVMDMDGTRLKNSWYGRRGRSNVSYINGRRGSTMSIQDKIGQGAMIESSIRNKSRKIVVKPRVINSKPRINNNIKPIRTYKPIPTIKLNNNPPRSTRPTRVVSTRSNNITPIRSNSKRKN